MKGRPRTPTSILDARGAFKNHPERRKLRKDEPVQLPELGDPPKCLDEAEREAWQEVVDCCAPGVLRRPDRLAVEEAARLLAKIRSGEFVHPSLRGRFHSLLGKFGMTPSERSKVSVPQQEPENAFAQLG